MLKRSFIATLSLVAALFVVADTAGAAEKKFVNIGTAGIGGGYYPTGGFICNVLNKSRKKYGHKVRCSVESTAGSVANLRAMHAGELDVAVAQADWQFHAKRGTSKFEDIGANPKLRFLFSLHHDVFHIVSRKGSGIMNFADLKGKVVNTGNAGSGTEATIYLALDTYGLKADEFFKLETKLTSREQASALCDGKIDAFIYPTGITAASITEATNTCDAEIANWSDDTVNKLVGDTSYFGFVTIPDGVYRGQKGERKSWGMPATLVATADADEEVIYYMVKAVFDNFEDFKKQSSLYIGLDRSTTVINGKSAEFHPGALKYFKEVGMVE